ncbi:DNA methylase, N-6 adenine-specific, conserved site [Ostreococcus tauri]|uniref:DNA methylase, N-6 adenine-specific, conserved site n=1 Tax=Ostreococcus tauri TaxID=70448 RepID=A0A096P9A3_OSTTA|nr:DNA methylase, N-6 adenine-specific, conserved site [Ostreococcus tauri]CEG00779.1 DNA methylase, N-6 adenine-specific, conserved site [Ostreococcus tauri]|eukprot:XP_022840577.1 DNA methylase, N-6 adenine-specific, conserved site [Ostreococcus tauri]
MSRFYATCHPGLEEVVARELASPMIDAREVRVGKSGVSFVGTQRVGYDANLWLRSAVRVLVELKRGYLDPGVSGTESVYEFIKRAAPWEEVVPGVSRAGEALTFAVETRVWDCSQITSSHAAKIRVKDAVCDALVDATGTRPQPPINYAAADVPLYVTLYRDEVIVYRDMSGESLHRRGYRNAMHRASLSESAAAGMLSLAGWPDMLEQWRRDPDGTPAPVLIDPMCGSGTFLIEAALMAANVAPGLVRAETIGYAFERWPDHDQRMFDACLEDARRIGSETRAACASPPVIIGNDIHPGAVTLAGQGAETARVSGMVEIFRNNCETFRLPSKIDPEARRVIVTNPPWGKRIGAGGDAEGDDGYAGDGEFDRDTTVNSNGVSAEEALEQCWNSLGVFLKRECPDTSAFVLSGNPAVSRAIRMRASRKHVVGIGGVDCRLLRYDILPPKPPGYVPTHRENRRDERNW